jgi:sulfite reductase (NADPH) flavoprotein alpha-component
MTPTNEGPIPSFSKDNPFPARMIENRLLSGPGSAKETRHVVLDLRGSGMSYEAGDSLAVFPVNPPHEVDDLIRHLGARGDELVTPAALKLPAADTLRNVLTERLALAGPTRRMVEQLAAKVTDEVQRARLAALLAPEAKDALVSFLGERAFVDLLAEFPSARFTPQEFVDQLRKLVPRLYSISSSPRAHPDEVHLTVAVVRYVTNERQRLGVCSTFLGNRVERSVTPVLVFVSHSHFGPPEDGSRDCIMVGPGTGIAPFRAFLQDRVASGATGRNWIFFGDQKRDSDFLYEDEWRAYLEGGQLSRLDTAFSRDQEAKIYVQDRMRENAAELWAWLKSGAGFYVCGDAKRMAKDVDAALHDIVREQGGMTAEAAIEFVKALKKDKRYQRDVY